MAREPRLLADRRSRYPQMIHSCTCSEHVFLAVFKSTWPESHRYRQLLYSFQYHVDFTNEVLPCRMSVVVSWISFCADPWVGMGIFPWIIPNHIRYQNKYKRTANHQWPHHLQRDSTACLNWRLMLGHHSVYTASSTATFRCWSQGWLVFFSAIFHYFPLLFCAILSVGIIITIIIAHGL